LATRRRSRHKGRHRRRQSRQIREHALVAPIAAAVARRPCFVLDDFEPDFAGDVERRCDDMLLESYDSVAIVGDLFFRSTDRVAFGDKTIVVGHEGDDTAGRCCAEVVRIADHAVKNQ
jgi:hypothetical protein